MPDLKPGQVVIMDNASFHKSPKIRDLIEEKQATLLFLPPYSPELNPIEHYWAMLKTSVKRTRQHISDMWESVIHALNATPSFRQR